MEFSGYRVELNNLANDTSSQIPKSEHKEIEIDCPKRTVGATWLGKRFDRMMECILLTGLA
jgi:hypothetical protein